MGLPLGGEFRIFCVMKPIREDKKTGDTRQSLIAAAAWLMSEKDTLDVSLAEIGRTAGANSALIKYYFGSKEGLLMAVLEQDFSVGLQRLERLVQSDRSPEEKMRLHIQGLIETYHSHPYLNRLVQKMSREALPENVEQLANSFIKPISEAQAQILEDGVASGVFRPIEAWSFYFQVVGSVSHVYAHRYVLKAGLGVSRLSKKQHEQNIEQVVDIIMRGIAA
ncbi:MAG: TetR family transcriptional regulator [Pseudomonadota bacterium]